VRRILAPLILLCSGTTVLRAQDTLVPPPRKSYSTMYERLEVDDRGRASLLMLRWNRWHPGGAEFEGSFGLLTPGGIAGEAGAAYMIGEGPVMLVVRGGITAVAVAAEGVAVPLGAYGGVALLVGPGHTALRLEVARHEYVRREERFGGWMLGVGLAFIPRPRGPTDRDR
jgi:hypothetical protein